MVAGDDKRGREAERRLRGVITVVQESRFRLVDARGRGYLLGLARGVNARPGQLREWARARTPLVATYRGEPDYDTAAALRIEPAEAGGS